MAVVCTLTVPAGKVASTLTNFVTRVNLANLPAAWWTDTTSDLGNVRVKSAGSVIPFDVVSFDRTAKTGELFFKATLTTSANVFTVETVDGATALSTSDTNGRNNVWVDYACAFVFTGGSMADRSGHSGDATVKSGTLGTPTNAGWLSTNASAVVQSLGVGFNQTFTFGASFWQYSISSSNNNNLISYSTDTTTTAHRESICIETGVNPAMWNSTESFFEVDGSEAATPNTAVGVRERIVGVKNGTTSRYLVRNGVKGSVDTGTSARPTSPGNAFYMGSGSLDTTSRFNGELNYAYLRFAVLSDDWLAAENASWEGSTFYAITTTVSPPAATATATAVAPTVTASSTVAAVAATATATAVAPTVGTNASATVVAVAATATASASAPVVSADSSVTAVAATATATALAPTVDGTGNATIEPPAATATATAVAPSLTWGASVAATPATATAAAVAPTVSGTSNATVTAVAATATAAAIAPSIFNDSPDATVEPPAATATATAHAPVVVGVYSSATDTTNLAGGRVREATGAVTITRPVEAVPVSVGTRVDKALAYPAPTMVDGRPT